MNEGNVRNNFNRNENSSNNYTDLKNKDFDETCDNCILKMRGLPWSATAEDIMTFLGDCCIKGGKDGVHLTMSPLGRPSGEAYIEFVSSEDANKALKKDREHMGHRYIEVFRTTRSEMDWVVSRCGMNMENIMDEGCIRMRGLPYGCTKEEVSTFFSGLAIVPNGITFATDYTGRATGEAYVQFVNKENVEKALKKHMEKIGHRYIEIFRSSLAEINSQTGPKMRSSLMGYGRTAPYDRSDRFGGSNRLRGPPEIPRLMRYRDEADYDDYDDNYWGRGSVSGMNNVKPMRGNYEEEDDYIDDRSRHFVHMRGLPYRAIENDIVSFFRPLDPIDVRILYDKMNRPSGEAVVEFTTHEDAVEAMNKDKEHIQNRYIELFLDSVPEFKEFLRRSDLRSDIRPMQRSREHVREPLFNNSNVGERFRGSMYGSDKRGQGTKPFMSSAGNSFRSNW